MPSSAFTRQMRAEGDKTFMEYAPLSNAVEKDMADTMQTEWAVGVLKRAHTQPFFLALGLYAPHFPNYAPQKYYDLYPLDEIKLPPIKEGDTDDLPPALKKFNDRRKATIHDTLNELGLMKEVLRAYLASISYADAMLGRVLAATLRQPAFARDRNVLLCEVNPGGSGSKWVRRHSQSTQTA